MWKKTESDHHEIEPLIPPITTSQPRKEPSIIGPSIVIKGEVMGDEDILVQGKIEGKIELTKNNVTVGRNGNIKADINGKTIQVEGEVQGNLYAQERIVIRQSGHVRGNISAPRVTLEDGARFKGSIDMDGRGEEKQRSLSEISSTVKTTVGGRGEQKPVGGPTKESEKRASELRATPGSPSRQ